MGPRIGVVPFLTWTLLCMEATMQTQIEDAATDCDDSFSRLQEIGRTGSPAEIRRHLHGLRFPIMPASRNTMPGDFSHDAERLRADIVWLRSWIPNVLQRFGVEFRCNDADGTDELADLGGGLVQYVADGRYLDELRRRVDAALSRADLLAFRDDLETLLANSIRPELDAAGMNSVYVVFASEIGVSHRVDFYGVTNSYLGQLLKDHIGNRWTGNGPAMVISDELILRQANYNMAEAKTKILAIAIHELSHRIYASQLCEPVSPLVTAENLAQDLNNWTHFVASTSVSNSREVSGFTWSAGFDSHNPRFGRLMFHLAGRLFRAGAMVRFDMLHNWPNYGNIQHGECLKQLVSEIVEHEGEPLSNLKSIDVPESFASLWRGDQKADEHANASNEVAESLEGLELND